MKSVRISAPNKYEIEESEIPEIINDNDVLVKMKASGVCGSDVHLYHGKNPNSTYPRIPGHENAGIVVKTGDGVLNVKAGDHVVIDLIITCGKCYQCRTGRENVCENVKVRGSGTDGGWREYILVPDDDVYVVPEEIPLRYAALIEPYAIGAHCTKRGRLVAEDTVLVLGAGTIGSVIVQTCKAKGCTVIACDIQQEMLDRAGNLGADYTINSRSESIAEKVQEFTGGTGVTIAFDSACFQGSLTSLFAPGIVCNAGRIVSLGFETRPEAISQAMLDIRELDLIGSRMSAYQFKPTIEAFLQKKFDYKKLASTFIPFSEIERVFHYMDNPHKDVKKMVITFD